MTTSEIKSAINKILDTLPENVLIHILNYLQVLSTQSGDQIALSQNMRKILNEDRELLEKLAS
jgi:hypothetical protein